MPEINLAEENKPAKKLNKLQIAIIASSAVLVIFVVTLFCLSAGYNRIFGGISISSYDVGSMSADEAQIAVEKYFESKIPQVEIDINGSISSIPLSSFGNYDYAAAVNEAYNYGKGNIFSRLGTYITPYVKRDILLKFNVDENKFASLMQNECAKLENPYTPSSYRIEEDKLIIVSGNSGAYIDINDAINQVKNNLSNNQNFKITAKIIQKEYSGVDVDSIYNSLSRTPENAYYVEETKTVVPHKTAYNFNLAAVKEETKNLPPDTEYVVTLDVVYPEITEAKLLGKMFEDVLASYTTKYNTSEINRTYNMTLAGNMVNETILAPGEVFSYNDVVGERTVEKGYRYAKVFEGNRVVDGLAGGICQVSTTIYNAALYSNMEIVERKNHSFPVSYAPKGQDATVVMGAIDFKFKNSMKNPIKLTCKISDGKCTVEILGIKEKNYKIDITNTIVGSTPYATEYRNDESLEPGVEKVIQNGSYGYTIKSTRTVYENGNLVKTEPLTSSYYIPLAKIVARNEKALENTPSEETQETQETEETKETEEVNDPQASGQPEVVPSEETNAEVLPTEENPPIESEPEVTSPELNLETEIYL